MSRCGTCNVQLEAGDAFREHYGSEWHLTNVRRRVEGLRALTIQEYKRTGGASGAGGAEEDGEEGGAGAPLYSCTLCKKTFRSVQTLQTHVRSTAHLIRKEERIISRDSQAASMLTMTSLGSAAMGLHRRHNAKKGNGLRKQQATGPARPKVSLEDREEDTDATRCIFCGLPSRSVEANLEHLKKYHEFTIPMVDRCTDVEGLMNYLARKVNGLMCVVCNEKTRSYTSLEALRDHMRESYHEKIVLNPEYQEFYSIALEDPDKAEPAAIEGVRGDELVVGTSEGKSRGRTVVLRREADVPRARPRETELQMEKRHAILAEETTAMAVAKREHREAIAVQNKELRRTTQRSGAAMERQQLRVSMISNKLHPYGYDGEA